MSKKILSKRLATAFVSSGAVLTVACSGADPTEAPPPERIEVPDPIPQFEADENINGLAALLIEDFRRGEVQMRGNSVLWSPPQERARDAITNLVLKNPSVYQLFNDSVTPLRFIKKDDYDRSGLYFANALRKHVATVTLAHIVAKEDVEGLIDFRHQLLKYEQAGLVESENFWAARDMIRRLTRQDASIHASVDAKLVALRDGSHSERIRKSATDQLTDINEYVFQEHREKLLIRAFSLAGLDSDAETITPPGGGTEYTAPNDIPSGLLVDVVFHWLKPPMEPHATWSEPELWRGDGILRGRSKAEIDAYFDGITHVGLYLYERSRDVGSTVGTQADGSECYGVVIQSIYYAYRIGLRDNAVEGLRLMGHVNPPGQTYLDRDCNTTAGLPSYDPFLIRQRD